MFTLKLYRSENGQRVTHIQECHNVQVMQIGASESMLELWALKGARPADYDTFYIGDPDPGMDALTQQNHYQWGLLENAAGKTTEHFRPAGYGL